MSVEQPTTSICLQMPSATSQYSPSAHALSFLQPGTCAGTHVPPTHCSPAGQLRFVTHAPPEVGDPLQPTKNRTLQSTVSPRLFAPTSAIMFTLILRLQYRHRTIGGADQERQSVGVRHLCGT